jgi:hypothetical protein
MPHLELAAALRIIFASKRPSQLPLSIRQAMIQLIGVPLQDWLNSRIYVPGRHLSENQPRAGNFGKANSVGLGGDEGMISNGDGKSSG